MAKLLGDYAASLDSALYADTPKAVFAAIALSVPHNGGASYADLTPEQFVATEWDTQNRQGLIPQSVPARWRHLIVTSFQEAK